MKMRRDAFLKTSLPLTALLALVACGSDPSSQQGDQAARARFVTEDVVERPEGYRGWEHVGTRLNPIKEHIFDGKKTLTPELMHTYVEPAALATFRRTGQWPDGTQIAKEFTSIQVGKDCDPRSMLCRSDIGEGIFEDRPMGLGLMIKDKERFPDSPGNWGFFDFGHQPMPYEATAKVRPFEKCMACHVALAADTDYVIRRAHLGLQR